MESNIKNRYGLFDFNDYNVLKVSPTMWAVIAYLGRHFFVFLIAAVFVLFAIRRRGAGDNPFDFLNIYFAGPEFVLASIPPLLLALIAFRLRKPEAKPWVRMVWKKGGELLIASAVMDIVFILTTHAEHLSEMTLLFVVAIVFDIYAILYVVKSRRVKDTFADFPSYFHVR